MTDFFRLPNRRIFLEPGQVSSELMGLRRFEIVLSVRPWGESGRFGLVRYDVWARDEQGAVSAARDMAMGALFELNPAGDLALLKEVTHDNV
jgi:hypothetical protein